MNTTSSKPDFQPVLDLAKQLGQELNQGGFSVTIFHRGQEVLSHSAGWASKGTPYTNQTLSVAFSCTKGIASILMGMLMDEGLLKANVPVASYLPEFSKVSSTLTVSELMQHRAGLSAPRENLSFEQGIHHEYLLNSILNQEPLFEPGSSFAYHALTFGTLLQELAIRVSGKTLGELLQEKITKPLTIHGYIGIPEEKQSTVSELIALEPFVSNNAAEDSQDFWSERALTLGSAFPSAEIGNPGVGFNSPLLHQAELPGVNGIFSSHSLAKIWSATVYETAGVKLLSAETLRSMREVLVDEPNFWGESPTVKRGMGLMLHTENIGEFLSSTSFGHDGFGGRVGFADPLHEIGFAYTSNLLHQGENQHSNWKQIAKKLLDVLER